MPESFLHLDVQEQFQIYQTLAPQLGRSPVVLEKDVWVCWVLQTLFTMPGRLPMAFKGGTSLSKVFGAIARFSEDVDITLDYSGLDDSFDPFAAGVSRNQLKNFSEKLKSLVHDHVHGVVAPHIDERLTEGFDVDSFRLEISDDGEQLRVHYPTVLKEPGDYLGNSVLLDSKCVVSGAYVLGESHVDACRVSARRIPLAALRDDFQRMIAAGMFIGDPPVFDDITDRLRTLEKTINQ